MPHVCEGVVAEELSSAEFIAHGAVAVVDFVVPGEEPHGEVREDSESGEGGVGPPCCAEETEVGYLECVEGFTWWCGAGNLVSCDKI